MPNILAHVGAQGILTRAILPQADLKIIFLGCLLPDVPWIIARVIRILSLNIDPYILQLYAIAQASLFVTLFVCGAIAVISEHPSRVFAILGLNVVLHLLLDMLQTKWANGVHFFAPFSWEILNFELFWPESVPTYFLTLLGLVYLVWKGKPAMEEPPPVFQLSQNKIILSIGLFMMYLVLPGILLEEPLSENNHYIKTLQAKNERVGQEVEIDRALYRKGEKGDTLETFGNEEIRILIHQRIQSSQVSVRGRFVDPQTLKILDFHEHVRWFRDGSSVIGILVIISLWLVAWFRPIQTRGTHDT